MKADGTDTSGLAELLGKCHHKPTTNASDLANYTVGTNMFPFTVLCVPAWVQEKQFLTHPGIQLVVQQTVKLHFTARLFPAFKQRGSAGRRDCEPGERSGSRAALSAEWRITPFANSAATFFSSTKAEKATKSSDSGLPPHNLCTSLHFSVNSNAWQQISNSGEVFLLCEAQLLTLFSTVQNNIWFIFFLFYAP